MRIFIILLLLTQIQCIAQSSGELSNTFGVNGVVLTELSGSISPIAQVIRPIGNGDLAVAGSTNDSMFIVVYNSLGESKLSFGRNGILKFVDSGTDKLLDLQIVNGKLCVYVQASGKLIIHKFNSDGTPDLGFGISGIKATNFYCPGVKLLTQKDGKIIIGGTQFRSDSRNDIWLQRYNPDGSKDNSFGNSGQLLFDLGSNRDDFLTSMCIQANGRILICGSTYTSIENGFDLFVARITNEGNIDASFHKNNSGIIKNDYSKQEGWNDILELPSGRIVTTGSVNVDSVGKLNFLVSCIDSSGEIETSFGVNGILQVWFASFTRDVAFKVLAQGDGNLLIVGNSGVVFGETHFAFCRILPTGIVDSTFGEKGQVDFGLLKSEFATSSIILGEDVIIAGGSVNRIALTAFKLGINSSIPLNINHTPIIVFPNPTTDMFFIETNNGILISSAYITNLQGERIRTFDHLEAIKKVDITDLSKGIFFLIVDTSKGRHTCKIIKY